MTDLERLAERLGDERLIAADTEAAGYHRYADHLCLLQLSTRSDTWLVDTMALGSLNPLAELFADPAIEVIFHDADYDLRLLDRDFGVHVRGLFDTQIAARFAGQRSFGLSNLLGQELGIDVPKKHQRADWARRPLSQEMLDYAAMDTRHLPTLRDRLRSRLEEMGRLAWADEEFRIQEQTGWTPPDDEETGFLRLKGARDLDRRSLAALREVFAWREARARARDQAPFRVLSNDALIGLARELPADERALASIPGLAASIVRRHGAALLAAVARARALPESELPSRPRPPRGAPRDPELERRVEGLKAVRDREADRLGLERGFLMPRAQLEELARRRPGSAAELAAILGVRRWQVEAMGAALLREVQSNGRSGT